MEPHRKHYGYFTGPFLAITTPYSVVNDWYSLYTAILHVLSLWPHAREGWYIHHCAYKFGLGGSLAICARHRQDHHNNLPVFDFNFSAQMVKRFEANPSWLDSLENNLISVHLTSAVVELTTVSWEKVSALKDPMTSPEVCLYLWNLGHRHHSK